MQRAVRHAQHPSTLFLVVIMLVHPPPSAVDEIALVAFFARIREESQEILRLRVGRTAAVACLPTADTFFFSFFVLYGRWGKLKVNAFTYNTLNLGDI